jgi:transcriptional regulator with XRE-family HTH domain
MGRRLKALRETLHLSQGDIQNRTGLSRSYVSRVENGDIVPGIQTLKKWSNGLKIPLYKIFYNRTSRGARHDELDVLFDKKASTFHNFRVAFKKMSQRDREILFALARQMATNRLQSRQLGSLRGLPRGRYRRGPVIDSKNSLSARRRGAKKTTLAVRR